MSADVEWQEGVGYLVTLAASCTCRVYVQADTASEARQIAEMGDGQPFAPWTAEVKPRTRKVERA